MKPFKRLTLKQQKARYLKSLKRQLKKDEDAVRYQLRGTIARIELLYVKKRIIQERIGRIQDKVADAADKRYGGWDVWRHNEILLQRVVKDMDDAASGLYHSIAELDAAISWREGIVEANLFEVWRKYRLLSQTV
jgi:hypothetical protein